MARPDWISTDLTKVYFAAERQISPRLEAAVRSDAVMDALVVTVAIRRLVGRAVWGVGNGLVEAVGLPSNRQVRRLQQSVDALTRSRS